MASITTINSTDLITNSRSDINTNFANLNSDKIETSYLDTDTTLAANSDSKIATQKAVKTYIDTQGGANASTTVRGIVEEATSAEMIAGTGTGGTGARLFINPTLVAETGNDIIVKTKSTGKLDSSIIPSPTKAAGKTSKDGSNTTTTTIAHGLGSTPTLVYLDLKGATSGGTYSSSAFYYSSTAYSNRVYTDTSSGTSESSGETFRVGDESNSQIGTITVDATNISISWSGATFTGMSYIIWSAFL